LTSIVVEKHATLLVEFQESSVGTLQQHIGAFQQILEELPLSMPAALTDDPGTRASLWHIRKGLYASVAGNRPSGTTALLEDIAVPVASLLDTCEGLTELFSQHNYKESVIFGHAKDGHIHFLINVQFDRQEKLER
jgi:D-lactate dehydrogenase